MWVLDKQKRSKHQEKLQEIKTLEYTANLIHRREGGSYIERGREQGEKQRRDIFLFLYV